MPTEFELIERYFHRAAPREDVVLGVGDDAALLRPPPGQALALTVDTLVAGVHFPEQTPPEAVGHKALAVNLSDLAAMGARPAWVTLALTLPRADEAWLEGFARGFMELLAAHGAALVGGDTTRGPLSVSVQACGFVPEGQALRRDGARPGDLIYVTGTLGDAALGLAALSGEQVLGPAEADHCLARLDRPEPRVAAGLALRGLATAAIDISDGLVADLGHVLAASGAGAVVELQALPLSPAVRRAVERGGDWSPAVAGGDDYELLFTVPEARRAEVAEALAGRGGASCIGRIEAAPGLRLLDGEGRAVRPARAGWDHFAEGDL